jgi:hypothetical protein
MWGGRRARRPWFLAPGRASGDAVGHLVGADICTAGLRPAWSKLCCNRTACLCHVTGACLSGAQPGILAAVAHECSCSLAAALGAALIFAPIHAAYLQIIGTAGRLLTSSGVGVMRLGPSGTQLPQLYPGVAAESLGAQRRSGTHRGTLAARLSSCGRACRTHAPSDCPSAHPLVERTPCFPPAALAFVPSHVRNSALH